MTVLLNVGAKIRCIAHYSTSTTRNNVYEIGKVDGGATTDGRISYHYVDDDADDANMDTISHDSLATYFEVVGADKSAHLIAALTERVSELESVIKRIKEALANDWRN